MLSEIENFYLKFPKINFIQKATLNDKFLFLGSCFAENIGKIFSQHYFETMTNPLGITFNPHSLHQHIVSIDNTTIVEEHFVFNEEKWKHLDFHSMFNNTTQFSLKNEIEIAHKILWFYIENANHIFITLGTAWVYKFCKTKRIINNCQKLAQNKFEKVLLEETKIYTLLCESIEFIKTRNPHAQIIFTVSPVRHIKNGLWENNVSKGRLLSAVFKLAQNKNVSYFPSYEILIDVLRDYRFYNPDKIHPTVVSTNILWNLLKKEFFSTQDLSYFKDIENYHKLTSHRVTTNSRKNIESIETFKKALRDKYLFLKNKI